MERLTVPDEKMDGGLKRAHIIDVREVRKYAMTIYWALKKYEDTGLSPEEIMELKERDTAKKTELINGGTPVCFVCGAKVFAHFVFCKECGQRIKNTSFELEE